MSEFIKLTNEYLKTKDVSLIPLINAAKSKEKAEKLAKEKAEKEKAEKLAKEKAEKENKSKKKLNL